MSLADSLEVIAEDADVTTTAAIGSDLAVDPDGDGAGLREGVLYEFELTVQGAITGTSPTLAAVIQGKDSDGDYFTLAAFPTLGAATSSYPNAAIESGASNIKAYGRVPYKTLEGKEVTLIRAYGTVTGSNSPTWNDVNIVARPAMMTGSIS